MDDQVRRALHIAVREAVRSGARVRRRPGRQAVMETACAYAEQLLAPAVEQLLCETEEGALVAACRPWGTASAEMAMPSRGSPLEWVWVHGAVTVLDLLAAELGVRVEIEEIEGADLLDRIGGELRLLLARAWVAGAG